MKVSIEFVEYLTEHRKKINSVPLSEIDWYAKGVKLNIEKAITEEFEFAGLNNIDFITSGFYRTGFTEFFSSKDEKHNKPLNSEREKSGRTVKS